MNALPKELYVIVYHNTLQWLVPHFTPGDMNRY